MTKVIFEEAKIRVKIDKEENLIICEANWEDPDNTEEWFCHIDYLVRMIFDTAVFRRIYTDDLRWYISADRPGCIIIHNENYNVSYRIYKSVLETILTN